MEQHEIQDVINGILSAMKGQVDSIILFGSVARGNNDDESDVDIAFIFNGKKSAEQEDALVDYFVEMDLKYDKIYSIIDIEKDQFDKWKNVSPFYKNIIKEGIVLWKAA